MNPTGVDYEVSLTGAQPVHCERGTDCRGAPKTGVHPPGTRLYQVTLKRKQQKMHMCLTCYQYYTSKSSTTVSQRADEQTTPSGSHSRPPVRGHVAGHIFKGDAHIHTLVAKSQRREKVPIRAIGSISRSAPGDLRVAHSNGGYNPNHSSYDAAVVQNRSRALGVHSGLKGAVTGRLVFLKKTKFELFEGCQVGIGNVSVNIGAMDLLKTVFDNLFPMYVSAIKALRLSVFPLQFDDDEIFELCIDNVKMVDEHGVPLNMALDSDIIRDHFFKPVKDGGLPVAFKNKVKPFVVLLQLDPTWYIAYMRWRSEVEQREFDQDEETELSSKRRASTSVSRPRGKRVNATFKIPQIDITSHMAVPSSSSVTSAATGRAAHSVIIDVDDDADAPSDQLYKLINPKFPLAPTAPIVPSALRQALSSAKKTSAEDARVLVETRMFNVTFRKVKFMSLADLIGSASDPQPDSESRANTLDRLLGPISEHKLTVNTSHSSVGGFKTAYFGEIIPSPFDSTSVCVKQAHEYDKTTGKIIIRPSKAQLTLLPDELRTQQWAAALLTAVYDHMSVIRGQMMADRPMWKPQLPLPQLCFADAGFATEQGESSRAKLYLVEERIGGEFKKYIHNGSARLLPSARDDHISLFLSFTQHAQFVLSHGSVFVSDYQGGLREVGSDLILLTDPQLITNPKLGNIFAGGNVPASYFNFCKQHECNPYCHDYRLPSLKDFVPEELE